LSHSAWFTRWPVLAPSRGRSACFCNVPNHAAFLCVRRPDHCGPPALAAEPQQSRTRRQVRRSVAICAAHPPTLCVPARAGASNRSRARSQPGKRRTGRAGPTGHAGAAGERRARVLLADAGRRVARGPGRRACLRAARRGRVYRGQRCSLCTQRAAADPPLARATRALAGEGGACRGGARGGSASGSPPKLFRALPQNRRACTKPNATAGGRLPRAHSAPQAAPALLKSPSSAQRTASGSRTASPTCAARPRRHRPAAPRHAGRPTAGSGACRARGGGGGGGSRKRWGRFDGRGTI